MLCNVFFKSKMKTLESREFVFNSLVKSVIMYCMPIWGIDMIERITVFQNSFIRRIFGLPSKTPIWYLRLELAIQSIEVSMIRNTIGFLNRIRRKPENSIVKQCYHCLLYTSPSPRDR